MVAGLLHEGHHLSPLKTMSRIQWGACEMNMARRTQPMRKMSQALRFLRRSASVGTECASSSASCLVGKYVRLTSPGVRKGYRFGSA